jgi:hypothetical protein
VILLFILLCSFEICSKKFKDVGIKRDSYLKSKQSEWKSKKVILVMLSFKTNVARQWWLKPVILATQEAKNRRITVRSQPGQTVRKTLS